VRVKLFSAGEEIQIVIFPCRVKKILYCQYFFNK